MTGATRYELRRLHNVRLYRTMTLDDVATAADVTVSTLSRLENGRQQAYASTVVKLARALNVTPLQLRGEEPLPWEQRQGNASSATGQVAEDAVPPEGAALTA